jgi:hypothetical protein
MKKLILFAFFIPCIALAQIEGSKQMFESPKLKTTIQSHKTVAILPFDVKITYRKQPKGYSLEGNLDQEQKMSKSIQGSMYTFLLRKADEYSVSFQDIDKTNITVRRVSSDL